MYTWGWLTAGQEASHPHWGIDGEAVHEKETFCPGHGQARAEGPTEKQ